MKVKDLKNWRAGKEHGTIVCDVPEFGAVNHSAETIEYYGGYPLAESISDKAAFSAMISAPGLLVAAKAAIAVLSQNAVFPADIVAAKKWLSDAIAKAETT